MFIEALFTIVKIWEQPKCPSTDEWIKMWFIYTYEILPFAATWVDLEGIMLSEISQRKTNAVKYHLYVESKKYNKLVNKTKEKQIHRYREQTNGYQWDGGQYRGGGVGGTNYKV